MRRICRRNPYFAVCMQYLCVIFAMRVFGYVSILSRAGSLGGQTQTPRQIWGCRSSVSRGFKEALRSGVLKRSGQRETIS
jgi:hypothetical protein